MAHEERRDQSDTIEGQFGEEILKALVQNLWLEKELGQSMIHPLHFYEQSNQQHSWFHLQHLGQMHQERGNQVQVDICWDFGTCKFLIAVDIIIYVSAQSKISHFNYILQSNRLLQLSNMVLA